MITELKMRWFVFIELHKAHIKATKEILRWLVLFSLSWIIVETLKQLELVPEYQTVKLWVFNYVIPVRLLVNILLTVAGRYVDKFLHEKGKEVEKMQNSPSPLTKGLVRF